jgi:hypothetical protein
LVCRFPIYAAPYALTEPTLGISQRLRIEHDRAAENKSVLAVQGIRTSEKLRLVLTLCQHSRDACVRKGATRACNDLGREIRGAIVIGILPTPRSVRQGLGSSCAPPGGCTCASTVPWTSGVIPCWLPRPRPGCSGTITRCCALGRSRSNHGKSLGFAGRNFYTEPLAALEVERDYQTYFGPRRHDPPLRYDSVMVADYIPLRSLARCVSVDVDELLDLNPAILDPVRKGRLHVPRG